MGIFWRTSAVGAELIQASDEAPKDEKVLGAVEVSHGYCFPWAKNSHGIVIHLVSRFSEHLEKAKADVVKYLTEIGLLTETPTEE
ncbi:hypothetical protein [Runella sp.]|uniref:hypothetical protein n=1 Tax=Runella sp. TaxID=1960881 RepID=UPI003D126674